MWDLDNRTPFAAERTWVRDRDGAELWIVAVKATFDIDARGRLQITREQPPVLRTAVHYGDPATTSIKYDADLVRTKTGTDVVVVGHAYAPAGRLVAQLDAAFRVGPLEKRVRVFGDRRWTALGASAPEAFAKMPVVYERAFGGVDPHSNEPERDWSWDNPVGVGFGANNRSSGIALPNIEDPDRPIRSTSDRPAPAGFGVVAAHWRTRAAFAGTYDDHWMRTRQPLLPEDFDDRFYQCAPQDQQVDGFLRGGESVVLQHLTPTGALHFTLPRLHLGFETFFYDDTREIHADRHLHTVIIEPDFPRVSLVWHSALPCHFKVQKLQGTVLTWKTDLGATDRDARFGEIGVPA
jgi:hypothetical protein